MAIEESKIIDLIALYEKYEKECLGTGGAVNSSRARLHRAIIKDLESLLPRKTLADLDVAHFTDLTGTIAEYGGMKGVILGGSGDTVVLFTFVDTCVVYADPSVVCLLDEDRVWDETGRIL